MTAKDSNFRDYLIKSVEEYLEFDKLPSVSVDDIVHQMNTLVIISGYKFTHSWGDMELYHDWWKDKSEAYLVENLNNNMRAEYLYYAIPYTIAFIKNEHFYTCDIRELIALDPREELVNVLHI